MRGRSEPCVNILLQAFRSLNGPRCHSVFLEKDNKTQLPQPAVDFRSDLPLDQPSSVEYVKKSRNKHCILMHMGFPGGSNMEPTKWCR